MPRHRFAALPLLLIISSFFAPAAGAADAPRQPATLPTIGFPGPEVCSQNTRSNLQQHRGPCERFYGINPKVQDPAQAITRADWTRSQDGRRPIVDHWDFFHRLFVHEIWNLIDLKVLNSRYTSGGGNNYGLANFQNLSPDDRRYMIQRFAQVSGYPTLRAVQLYVHAFHDNSLPKEDVLRALGTIGGEFALDVIVHEGLASPQASIRVAAVQAIALTGRENPKLVTDYLAEQDRQLNQRHEQAVKEEAALRQGQPGKLEALQAELAKQLAQLEQDKAKQQAAYEAQRAQLRQRNEQLKQGMVRALSELQGQGAAAPAGGNTDAE